MKKLFNTFKNKKKKIIALFFAVVVLLVIISGIFLYKSTTTTEPEPEIISVSTLQRIINVSELSTYTAVYNGVAEVYNEQNPEKIDYYVAYEAKVNAGIDFEEIVPTIDHEEKVITVTIPDIFITDINVNISSLDFIFVNDNANTSTVSQKAFLACEADVKSESEQHDAIYNLAKQNAINIVTALIDPIVEQLDAEYTLIVR